MKEEVIATSENVDVASLGLLAVEANRYYEIAHNESLLARSHVSSALIAAIKCGQVLNKAKDLTEHGMFMHWVKTNCPRIAHQTANRYMKLAGNPNYSHVSNSGDTPQPALGLRQAYLLADMIQEPKKSWLAVPDAEAVNSGQASDDSGHELKTVLDPMDGKTSEDFPYDSIDGGTTVEFLDGDRREVYSVAAQGMKSLLKWILKGDGNSVLSRALACSWVLGVTDDERFESFPSQHNLAISYSLHPTSVSRNAAEFTRTYGIQNRAQAHGDGVRKV